MDCSGAFLDIQYYSLLVCAILSIFGCVVVITTCIYGKLLEGFSFRIITYMAINDLIRSIAIALPVYKFGFTEACGPLGYILTLTFVSDNLWAACISITLYQVIVKNEENYEKYHKYWLVLNYVIAPILEAIPFFTDSYGYDDGLCTLKENNYANLWRLSLVYVPSWLLMILVSVIFIKVYKKLKLTQKSVMKDIIYKRGYIYPIIIVALLLPMTALRISQAITVNCIVDYFSVFSYSLIALHGFLNAIAFWSNEIVKFSLKRVETNNEYYANPKDFLTGGSAKSYDSIN